jgi:hypothetical protein
VAEVQGELAVGEDQIAGVEVDGAQVDPPIRRVGEHEDVLVVHGQ